MKAALRAVWLAPPLLLFALPIIVALPVAVWQGVSGSAWSALASDSQVPRAVMLSIGTALVSTLISLALTLWLVTHLYGSRAWTLLSRTLGPMLAVPHAAFAIGLALLVMPAGVIARLLALPLGWSAPPDWPTVNDANGVGLTLSAFHVILHVLSGLPCLLLSEVSIQSSLWLLFAQRISSRRFY